MKNNTFDILSIVPEDSRHIILQFLENIDKTGFDIIYPGFYELTEIKTWKITNVTDTMEDVLFYTSKTFCEKPLNILNLYIHFKLGELYQTVSISKHAVETNNIKYLLLSSDNSLTESYGISTKDDRVNVKVSRNLIRDFNNSLKRYNIGKYQNQVDKIWSVKELYETVEVLIKDDKEKITTLIETIANKLKKIAGTNGLILSYLIHYMFLDERNLSYIFSAVNQGRGLGGLFVGYNNKNKIDAIKVPYIKSIANNLAIRLTSNSLLKLLHKQTLKTALISILVDSYAHNISAHSLSALKWWFELRHKIADKRFFVKESQGLELSSFQPEKLVIQREKIQNTAEIYYAALGLTDSIYNSQFCSLFDILNFNINQAEINKLLLYEESNQNYNNIVTDNSPECKGKVSTEEITDNGTGQNGNIYIDCFNPCFPVSLDYALFPFFRFLRDKGAFWSGVTRDNAYGGESKTWYKVLWEDFANNPLYLGTIAKSEGISKVNINLAIKKDESWTYGRFVTIDLSLLDYEERIATNPRLKIEYQKQDFVVLEPHLNDMGISNDIRDKERSIINSNTLLNLDAKLESILLSANNQGYTKYALIRLGECFAHFREIMSSEEYTIFLPGGVVGEHALFTIFENSLRNIKHYKNLDCLKRDGINFWISIEPEKLNISSVSPPQQKTHELFKVSVWLGHKTKLVPKENGENISIYEKLSKTTYRPIMDSYGMPIMGGNSQDKACAAMLFNNKFGSVEEKGEENKETRNGAYFPWVHFTTNTSQEPYNSEHDLPHNRIQCRIKSKDYDDEINKYKSSLDQNSFGYLKKHFFLWKNDDYLFINKASDLSGENISRFKFIIISSNICDPDEIFFKARQEGVIRILFETDLTNLKKTLDEEIPEKHKDSPNQQACIRDERLRLLYSFWLHKWISGDNFNIRIYKSPDINKNFSVTITKVNPYINIEKDCTESNISIPLSHGGNDESKSCNVRSHGVFWGKYFNKVEKKQASELFEASVIDTLNNDLTKYLLMDFAEVVTTNVFIFDNRIKSRMPINDEKLNVFRKNLKLVVEEERAFDKKKGESFKNHFNQLTEKYTSPNVLVMHLSYIESLGYKEMGNSMNNFINNELKDLIDNDNFILIITSGRGRDSWKEGLNKYYLKKTIFKPVESFIHAIESGISYNDNFDVKYNIIKVIFGS